MSRWLVRIYFCAAVLNYVFAVTKSYVNLKYNINTGKKNTVNSMKVLRSEADDNSFVKNTLNATENVGDIGEKRSLTAGDSFSPSEMLPIAEKLFNKVEDPGNGRGFVSSTVNPQMLADKLFEAFFFTTKRIIFLKDEDLSGLDALQALALSGEYAADSQDVAVSETVPNKYLRSTADRMKPKRCKYKLVSKSVTPDKQSASRKSDRKRIQLAKYLNKKRHLIVNKRRKSGDKQVGNKSERNESDTKVSSHFIETEPSGVTKDSNCHWKYECSNMVDLDTCRIHSSCATRTTDFTQNSDYTIHLEAFRKNMKIHYIDEEVEKILESRNLQLRPSNPAVKERVESLCEYFNKIIVEENLGITKALETERNNLLMEVQ